MILRTTGVGRKFKVANHLTINDEAAIAAKTRPIGGTHSSIINPEKCAPMQVRGACEQDGLLCSGNIPEQPLPYLPNREIELPISHEWTPDKQQPTSGAG
jgi:hypothetical protein